MKISTRFIWRTNLILQRSILSKKESFSVEGFTLIELMLVLMLISLLSILALPNFLSQVGKSRETEFLGSIGAVNRAQQAYHFEKKIFADDINKLDFNIQNRYVDQYDVFGNLLFSTVVLRNNEYETDATRAYSGGMFFDSGQYNAVMCSSHTIREQIPPPLNENDCQGNNILK